MNRFSGCFLAAGLIAVSGCDVAVIAAAEANRGQMTGMFEITFPAVMVVQFDDGAEEVLTGEFVGHISGSADWQLTGPTWGVCDGTTSKEGDISMICTSGLTSNMKIDPPGSKMSGISISEFESDGTRFVSGFGWGNGAEEDLIRAELAKL
jgi:hypothetical protein